MTDAVPIEGSITSVKACMELDMRPAGFDYLRIFLAFLIMVDHSVITCLGMEGQRTLFGGLTGPIVACLVPMFFALSGFLVASSLSRSRSLITFVGLRLLRIVPALAVDTIFCSLILGVVVTAISLREYFSSRDFFLYFLNILGDIHYHLPGVFRTNPTEMVNPQLWTIPYELKCYTVLTGMAVLGLHRHRRWFLLLMLLITIGIGAYMYVYPVEQTDVWSLLLPCFLAGVAIYLYQDKVERSWRLMTIALISAVLILSQRGPAMVLAAFPIAYLTVWLGLLRPRLDPLIRSGDYSYPLYLYSFPIQQTVYLLLSFGQIWWGNLLIATPLSFALAAFSWHLVEKPAQRQRHYLYAFENWMFGSHAKPN